MASSLSIRTRSSSSRAGAVFLLVLGALFALLGLRGLLDGQGVAAVFLLVGLGVLALGVWTWRYKPVALTGNPPVLRASEGLGIAFIGGFALLWNAIAWPVSVVLWRQGGGADGAAWVLAIFPLAGVLLAALALRTWARVRRLGRAALTLRPRQPTLGAPFDATLVFEGARAALPRDWRVRLKCEEVDLTRDADGDTRSRRRVLWQHEALARSDGARVVVRLPAGDAGAQQAHAQASSVEQGDGAIHWALEFEAQDGGDVRRFDLAIDPFDPHADPLPALPAAAPASGLDADTLRARLAQQGIEIGPASEAGGSGQWHFAARRNRATAWVLAITGALFAAAGATLASTGAATAQQGALWGGALFVALGAVMLVLGLLLATLRTGLRWRGGRAQVAWRSLLGGGEVSFDLPQVTRLVPVLGVRSKGTGGEVESLGIKAALADGRWVRLGGGIRGRLETQALLDRLQDAWRLRPDRVLRTEAAGRHRTGLDVQWRMLALRALLAAAALSALLLGGAVAFPHDYGWRNQAQVKR